MSLKSPVQTKTEVRTVGIDYDPHPGQLLFHKSQARYRIVCCGRKFGKTTMLEYEAFNWLGRPDTLIWWVAPYYNVAQIGYRRFINDIPQVVIKSKDKRNNVIEMINGSTIWFKSADNPDGLVGEGIDLLIMDEAARIKEAVWYETLQPNLADPQRLGYMCSASTPKGHNWFYHAWLRGVADKDGYKSWGQPLHNYPLTGETIEDFQGGLPSWVNPMFRLKDLEDAVKLPKKVFLQEYAARFLEDLGLVFTGVRGAIKGKFEEPIAGEKYFMGVDLAKTQDFTAIVIINEQGHVVYADRFQQKLWGTQINQIIHVAEKYNQASILLDSTGLGDPVYDFVKTKYEYVSAQKLTYESKREIIENLALCISQKLFTYPEDAVDLIEEIAIFGVEQTSGGLIRYEAPKGFHDDYVIASALAAWQALRTSKSQLGFEYFDFGII